MGFGNAQLNERAQIKIELSLCWEKLIQDIIAEPKYARVKDALEWLKVVMESNVPFGKQNR